jgi:MFS family permease
MIYPLLPVFLTSTLGATPLVVGLIEGFADALSSILKLASGWISDRLPRRKPLIVGGYALATISRAWISVAGVWVSVLLARLLDRTGKGIRSAPRDAMIADVTPIESRGRAFGFQRALDHTGAVVGPLLAIVLLDAMHLPMRTVFMFAVIPGAIGVVLLMFALREPPSVRTDFSRSEQLKPVASLPRRFYYALGAIGIFSLANSSDAFLLLQAHAAGVSVGMLPVLWSAHHVIKSAFSTYAGGRSDRTERRNLLAIGWTVYALIYFAFPFAHTMPMFVLLFVAYAIPFTLTEGAERAWIGDLVPMELRGRSYGFYYFVNGVCVLAGTALFGALYQSVSPLAAFFTGGGLALLAALSVRINRVFRSNSSFSSPTG